ncbi:MAG: DUF2760 domain-containing protein [Proteobacteria bacterium]|nr:DUF2760 domain-containing protein [Pseudomonadota bacterium]
MVTLPPGLEAAIQAHPLSGTTLTPVVSTLTPWVWVASLVLGIVALIAAAAARSAPTVAHTPAPVAEAVRPAPPPPVAKNQAEAEVIAFLGLLQAKGRLVDFLMDNINAYNDAQVGAAARVVHAGCKSVLDEHFRIMPVRAEKEQSKVEVPADYAADEYRLLGKISGQPPFTGALVHHGWKTDFVKLPTILRGTPDRLPAIAPAEVELK